MANEEFESAVCLCSLQARGMTLSWFQW